MTDRTCSIDGCDRVRQSKGYCDPHYRRYKTHGEPLRGGPIRARIRKHTGSCEVSGCGRKIEARKLCSAHYVRWKNTGSPLRLCVGCGKDLGVGLSRGKKYCSDDCKPRCIAPNCSEPQRESECCSRHAAHLKRHGSFDIQPAYTWATEWVCVVCGADVERGSGRRQYCSSRCQGLSSTNPDGIAGSVNCTLCGCSIETKVSPGKRKPRVDIAVCESCKDSGHHRRFIRYQIRPSEYLEAVSEGCEICGKHDIDLHVDHDHNCCPQSQRKTCGKCVRGYLCGTCNRGLGMLRDCPENLNNAIAYLNKSAKAG